MWYEALLGLMLIILHIILSDFRYPYCPFDYITRCSGKIVLLSNICILPPLSLASTWLLLFVEKMALITLNISCSDM